jgi:hypothetical protein
MTNIPILYKYLKQKSWGLPRPQQRCQWYHWNRFWRLSKWLSPRIRCHMQNGFSIYGVDWWKNRGSKISSYCPFKASLTYFHSK